MTDPEFHALALLRFVTQFVHTNQRPPSQREILTGDDSLNAWFDRSLARAEYPFGFAGGPTIHAAALLLSDAELMVPRGYLDYKTPNDDTTPFWNSTKNRRINYKPTPKGLVMGDILLKTDWRKWQSNWLTPETINEGE